MTQAPHPTPGKPLDQGEGPMCPPCSRGMRECDCLGSSPQEATPTERTDAAAVGDDAGRQAIWKVVHEVWQLLDDSYETPTGREIDEERWQAVSSAMEALEALVPDSEGPFWGGYPVNYLWPKGAVK